MDDEDKDPSVAAYLTAFDEGDPVTLVGSPRVVVEVAMPRAVATRTDLSFAASTSMLVQSIGNGIFSQDGGLSGDPRDCTRTRMSLFSDAQVTLLLADYAANDAIGKLNLIGGGITFLSLMNGAGSPTPPFTVLAQSSVPSSYADQQYALTVELYDATRGQIVNMPSETPGQMQALRAQQVVTVGRPILPPGTQAPSESMMMSNTMIMAFPSGLPLIEHTTYEWRVQIDGQSRHWFYRFHVLGQQPGVVFGGPANPPHIPGVGEYVVDPPEEQPPAQPSV